MKYNVKVCLNSQRSKLFLLLKLQEFLVQASVGSWDILVAALIGIGRRGHDRAAKAGTDRNRTALDF